MIAMYINVILIVTAVTKSTIKLNAMLSFYWTYKVTGLLNPEEWNVTDLYYAWETLEVHTNF
jgi:hypothetical protein